MNIPSLLCLSNHEGAHSRRLTELVSEFRGAQVFNPSFLDWNGHWLVTFRHSDVDQRGPSHAALLRGAMTGGPSQRVDLSQHVAAHGVERLADPKLFRLGDEAWITFNDGYSAEQNSLYLMRVAPELGKPLRCELEQRRAVEKNWAFMLHDGRLRALYSVDPVHFVSAPWPLDEAASCVRFAHESQERNDEDKRLRNGRALSIGTQLARDGEDTWLVAHEKWYFRGKRLYFGRATRLDPNTRSAALRYSPRRLSHSLTSLLGARQKHNPKLISCTYFSGIVVKDGHAILGYGINDIACHFAEIPVRLI